MSGRTYVVTIQHPGHVHFFKHIVRRLEREGHEVQVFCKDLELAPELLDHYDIDHEVLAGGRGGIVEMAKNQLLYESRLLARAVRLDPDVMTAIGGTAVSHVAPLVGARSIVFTDTEHAVTNPFTFPFANEVWTPECFHGTVRADHHTYPGYHELAYLHPDRFQPNPAHVEAAGLSPDEPYVVLRLAVWDASHDFGEEGLSDPEETVERLEATGARVVVIDEAGDRGLGDREVRVEPHKIHDLLAYADLFVGEGATMAAESAVLGTPAVYANTLRMGYTDEIEARYGLLFNCQGSYLHHNALRTAVDILDGDLDADWAARRDALLADKRDTTTVALEALRPDGAGGGVADQPKRREVPAND